MQNLLHNALPFFWCVRHAELGQEPVYQFVLPWFAGSEIYT